MDIDPLYVDNESRGVRIKHARTSIYIRLFEIAINRFYMNLRI